MPDIYAQVSCRSACGNQPLSRVQYRMQMASPNSLWKCPQCGANADFDDAHFEDLHILGEDDKP